MVALMHGVHLAIEIGDLPVYLDQDHVCLRSQQNLVSAASFDRQA
jgi:hypothetical protein